jgi:hypothetical protein
MKRESLVALGLLAAAPMASQAAMVEMDNAEMSEVHGQFNLISGINAGIFSDSVVSGVNAFGARSLGSGINLAAVSGATLDNHWGLAGASLVNHIGVSGVSGLNFLGLSGVSGVSGISLLGGSLLSGFKPVNGPLTASLISGVSLPFGATGASLVTLPASLNGFGLINVP